MVNDLGFGMVPFNGIPIKVCDDMAGTKIAMKANGVIHVSPAMWELMSDPNASQDDLQLLLRNIRVLDLGSSPPWTNMPIETFNWH